MSSETVNKAALQELFNVMWNLEDLRNIGALRESVACFIGLSSNTKS